MSNQEVGRCPCPICGTASPVKKFEKGRRRGQLYVTCAGKHGPFMNQGADFQDWILEAMTPNAPDGTPPVAVHVVQIAPPPPPEVIAAATTEKPPHVQPEKPARGGLFPLFN